MLLISLAAFALFQLILSGSSESRLTKSPHGMILGDENRYSSYHLPNYYKLFYFFSPKSLPCEKLGDTGGNNGGEPFDDACGIIKQLIVYTGPCGPAEDVVTGIYVVYWYVPIVTLLCSAAY